PNQSAPVFASKNMCRMVPLTGMFAKNSAIFGSKPTIRLSGPLSAYQMRPWSSFTSPYGRDSAPPGDGHSWTAVVVGSSRPSMPRASSPYQSMLSGVHAMRRERTAGSPNSKRVTSSVFGSMRAKSPARSSATQGLPSPSSTMPYGFDGVSFGVTSATSDEAMSSRPTRFDPCDVNQMWPSPSSTIV